MCRRLRLGAPSRVVFLGGSVDLSPQPNPDPRGRVQIPGCVSVCVVFHEGCTVGYRGPGTGNDGEDGRRFSGGKESPATGGPGGRLRRWGGREGPEPHLNWERGGSLWWDPEPHGQSLSHKDRHYTPVPAGGRGLSLVRTQRWAPSRSPRPPSFNLDTTSFLWTPFPSLSPRGTDSSKVHRL